MKVRVLGSYGSRLPGYATTSFLINERLLVDAGTVSWTLGLEEQLAVEDVLLSHAHLDHMVDLAFLADNVFARRATPVRVWAPEPVLDGVRRHLFNDVVWPDFTRLPSPEAPAIDLRPLPAGEAVHVGGVKVRWVPTHHTVFCAAYLLEKGGRSLLFSGDTAETEEAWILGRSAPDLAAVFVEASFPDRLRNLALASGHLTPAQLGGELVKLGRPEVPVKVFHMKPQYLEDVLRDLAALEGYGLQVLRGGEEFDF